MKRVEPGCLVIIIGEWKEHIGKAGEAVEFCPKGSEHTYKGVPFIMGRDCWGVFVRGIGIIDVSEKALLPIKPNADKISKHSDMELIA